MAIAIDKLHDFIRGTIKKNYGGFISPADIDRAINRAQFDLFDQLVENYKKTEKFDYDHLFLKQTAFTLANLTATKTLSSIDANFIEAITFYFKDSSNNLHEGNLMKWDSFIDRKNSTITPPVINTSTSEYKPIATIYDGKIEVAPAPPASTTYNFVLLYFRRPTDGKFEFTETNGVISQTTANENNSVNLDWDERSFSDIANRALTYLGFPIKDAELLQAETVIDSNQIRDGNQ
tara:strand:- start:4598 stop:5302 length:705 start_codon:yes stop_codon:yes gene_type:complete